MGRVFYYRVNNPLSDEGILTGDNFAKALCSGIHRVILQQDYLNRINVFPVADGDTGTNLSLSLGASLRSLNSSPGMRLDTRLAATADALLDGARGNSGAIMAQFFQGLSDAVVGQHEFTVDSFSRAVERGCEYAHDAIAKPQKGTVLSVIAVFARTVRSQVIDAGEKSFARVLDPALAAATSALSETRMQLEVLRKAGVVDAGAKGFVVLLEGMRDFLLRGQVTDKPGFLDLLTVSPANLSADVDSDPQYRYCTECMVAGQDIDRRKLRESLGELGNSLVLAGTKCKAKIHIHVNQPEAVFELARQHGTLSGEKADDMLRQIDSSQDTRAKFAVITDSAADIPEAYMGRLDIHMVPMRIQIGNRGYMDKVTISTDELFSELASNVSTVSSSQPTPGDFRRQYQFLASHFQDVISVSVTGSVSGTLQAAQSAAGLSTSSTLRALQEMTPVTQSFGLIKDLSYAVRGGRVSRYVKLIADGLRVTPLLGVTTDGKINTCGILPGRKNLLSRFAKFVARRTTRSSRLRVVVGHALCEDRAYSLLTLLQQQIPAITTSSVTELGAAFGVHGGPGTILVGLQAYRDPEEFR